MARIRLTENTTAEATPPTGQVSLFAKNDHELWIKRDDGTEDQLVAGSTAPSGPAGGDLAGTYPNPTLSAAKEAYLLDRANHTGTQDAATITGLAAVATSGDYADLSNTPSALPPNGAAGGDLSGTYPNPSLSATKEAYLLDRAHHTGTQSVSTITGLAAVATSGDYGDLSNTPANLPPSGPAGGDLAGTYPNPTLNVTTQNYLLDRAHHTGFQTASTISDFQTAARAATYPAFIEPNYIYVSAQTGNNTTGTGGLAQPYQTLAKAISVANPGSVIFLFPGLYTEAAVALPKNVYIQGHSVEFQNGFTYTAAAGDQPSIVIDGINCNNFTISAAAALNGTIVIRFGTCAITRTDTNQNVLLTVSESVLAGGTFAGGTNNINETLVISTITSADGSLILENCKVVATIEAQGPSVVRTLNCSPFGISAIVNGTVVGANTPAWETDFTTNYLATYTGAITKTILASVPAAVTTGFAIVATSGSFADLSSAPINSTGQMLTSLETAITALTDAPTIALDASQGNTFTVTLGGNRTMGTPSNPTNGQKIVLRVTQDATGNRLLTFNATWNFGVDLAGLTISTTANATDYVGAIYNLASSKWDIVSIVRGY